MVAVEDPLHLVHHTERGAAPVGLSKSGMAAPAAVVGAAARRDYGDRSGAVVFAPNAQVAVNVDALSIGPGLRIQVGKLLRGASMYSAAAAVPIEEAWNPFHRGP